MISSLFSLAGRVALVTGGNGGIGRSIALGFKEHGATVVVTGRNPDKNTAIASELGTGHAVIELDVRDEHAVNQAMTDIGLARLGFCHRHDSCGGWGLFGDGSALGGVGDCDKIAVLATSTPLAIGNG